MSKPYKELNAMPPESFLNPSLFITDYDTINPKRADEQYASGLETGRRCKAIIICANGTWSADTNDGGWITSYEGIGYHAHTASLLRGFIDSGTKIVVYRDDGNCHRTATIIKVPRPMAEGAD